MEDESWNPGRTTWMELTESDSDSRDLGQTKLPQLDYLSPRSARMKKTGDAKPSTDVAMKEL